MMSFFKYIVSFLCFLSIFLCLCESKSDLIERLPGLGIKPKFHQYSGYLNATEGRHLFYWFLESQRDPSKDPVVLFLNGGPGISSLYGLFAENGPFRVLPSGRSVTYDPYSWNSVANVLYVDTPAGVGFSYSDDHDYRTNDDESLKFNYEALKDFFKKYPQFAENEFYLTGEGFAAVYLSLLAAEMLNDQSSQINLKGLAIGNGFFDVKTLSQNRPFYAHYHGVIDTPTFNELKAQCCSKNGNKCAFPIVLANSTIIPLSPNRSCYKQFRKSLHAFMTTGINAYKLYDLCPKYNSSNKKPIDDLQAKIFDAILDNEGISDRKKIKDSEDVQQTHECVSNGFSEYLRYPEVRKALHVSPKSMAWNVTSDSVHRSYIQKYYNLGKVFKEINRRNLKTIIYNGDIDLVCDCVSTQSFLDSLDIPVVKESTNWLYNGVTAGFVKYFANNLTYTSIRDAGHSAPKDKPEPSLHVLKVLLGKDVFN
jgi:cathepsin A (carboxypeptidase C)